MKTRVVVLGAGFGSWEISLVMPFGVNRVGRVDIDFFPGLSPTGSFVDPSVAIVAEKEHLGSSRRARWFGV